ncbi:MAG: tetratricopeptide repeat protein, partial [Verrucomicrobiales bacterium]
LNLLQRTFIGRQRDLPVPSSLLIDLDGRVSVIYKGGVSVPQLVDDSQICGATSSEILARAIPFEGRWKTPPSGRLPRAVAVRMVDHGLLDDARAYLHQLRPLYQESDEPTMRAELGECERFLGAIAQEKKEFDVAKQHYESSLAITPGQELIHDELMRIYVEEGDLEKAAEQVEAILAAERNDYENLAQLGKFRERLGQNEEAIALYRESIALRPHPETLKTLADLLRGLGRSDEAIPQYQAALEQRPDWPLPANNLAWILATHPDPALRDPALAKRWAETACNGTGNRVPPLLGTLAAAHAALGEFERAVEVSARAVELANEFGKPDLAARLGEKMETYRGGDAFIDQSLGVRPAE